MKRLCGFLSALTVCLFLGSTLWARSLSLDFTAPVAEDGGDTIQTGQVTVSSSAATLIEAGTPLGTTPTLRRRLVTNLSSVAVFVGTSTVNLNTTGFSVDPSTGTYHVLTLYDYAPIYGLCTAGSSCTVAYLDEKNSVP